MFVDHLSFKDNNKVCFASLSDLSMQKASESLTELMKDETLLLSLVFPSSLFGLSVSNKLYCFPS